MRTKVTQEWLENQKTCKDGFAYWLEQKKPDLFEFVNQCIKDDHCDWANWLMARCMDRKQYLRYALYAVKQVEPIYRKHHPDRTIVTDVIRAVKACIKDDSDKNRSDAYYAAYAANLAAYYTDGYAESRSANVAANVADAAANAANSDVDVHASSYADFAVAYAAARVYENNSVINKEAHKSMFIKFLGYGMRIMKEKQ